MCFFSDAVILSVHSHVDMQQTGERRPIGDMPYRRRQDGLSVQDLADEHKLLSFIVGLFGILALLPAGAPQAALLAIIAGFVVQLRSKPVPFPLPATTPTKTTPTKTTTAAAAAP